MWRRALVALMALLLLALPALTFRSGGAGADEEVAAVNISATPDQPSAKVKLDGMQFYVPAVTADGAPATVYYFDQQMATRSETKPLVAVYEDAVADGSDVFGAYSRDDGATWQRANLSVAAERSSITLSDGPVVGNITKPALTIKGNRALVAWTSSYCGSGDPRYLDEPEADWWGVGGPQGSRDYDVDYPDDGIGERGFECVWTARGVVNNVKDSPDFGSITWFQPERLTSGKRWAMQIMANSASNAGFGVVWSEDPQGIRPGQGLGPGAGFTGANAHEGTDVWYSWIGWNDFPKVDATDVPDGSDPAEIEQRPRAAVRMSLPVRISDNQAVPAADKTGDRLYAEKIPALCAETAVALDVDDVPTEFCVTSDQRILDGDTFGTRPNLFVQPYQKPDLSYSAWAVVSYEESKGINRSNNENEGEGEGEPPCGTSGKDIVYHSFDVTAPERVTGGVFVNPQMTDDDGQPMFVLDDDGEPATDWKGDPIPARENARRVRLVGQPKAQLGASGTIMVIIFRQGEENQAGPADIVMRRVVVPAGQTGNPYRSDNIADGWANVSSVTPTATWLDPGTGIVKATRWTQTAANLDDKTSAFPDDDAVGLRGFMKGDFLALGYTWTPSLESAKRAKDVYNFYIRRSFDGGQSFTTDPAGNGAETCTSFTDPATGLRLVPECTDLAPGAFEPARNMSRLSGLDLTVIEPRLVGQPSTTVSPYPEDVQNTAVIWPVWGTGANIAEADLTADPDDEDEGKSPLDVVVTYTDDTGDTYRVPSYLAKGPSAQGEAQVRLTPDGSVLYASWNDDGPGPLDSFFRLLRASELPGDAAPPPPYVPPQPPEPPVVPGGGDGAPAEGTSVRGLSVVKRVTGPATNPFVDVLGTNVHYDPILILAKWGIARGVSGDRYAPDGVVTRAQMASFIARTLQHTSLAMPAAPDDAFDDDNGNPHELAINQLAALGIVQGRGPRVFAPDEPVQRAEAVTLMVRLHERLAAREMVTTRNHFDDDETSTHHANINKAAEAGITNGAGPRRFDTEGLTRRDQMASLLARLLDLMVAEGYARM